MSASLSLGDGRTPFAPAVLCGNLVVRPTCTHQEAPVDMDISMDIHAKICGYGYGYGWEISYPRQAWLWRSVFKFMQNTAGLN